MSAPATVIGSTLQTVAGVLFGALVAAAALVKWVHYRTH